MRDTKSGPPEEGNYQAPIASIFFGGMLSFQAGAFKVSKAFLPLERNSNFSRQSGFKVKSRFTNNTKGSIGKGKGKVTPLASDGGFEGAGFFERLHYINTSDIHKL